MKVKLVLTVFLGALLTLPLQAETLYREALRPQFHYSPPLEWMNDPNGMVYHAGEYHLFYQYHPYGNRWGPMHWGHAVSRDMVRWENLPIALFPDRHGAIFSGSAVVDYNNSSGFGTVENPPLVAIYTYHDALAEKLGSDEFQTQGIAYSLDNGRSWTKYEGNPVLENPGIRDFRDPKLSWYEPQQKWVMTLAVKDHISFYSSRDLKHWKHESDFGEGWGAHGGVWECPDLIEMAVDGEGTRKHVLIVSLNPGAPNGGSGTQYFVGEFDGERFVPDAPNAKDYSPVWLDYGTDNYAGVSWFGVPEADGRTLFLGWMNNWSYAQDVPTERWRGAMTLPRSLRLVRDGRSLALRSAPAKEVEALRSHVLSIKPQKLRKPLDLIATAGARGELLEFELALEPGDADTIKLAFGNAQGEQTVFRIDRRAGRYELDRSESGAVDFGKLFPLVQTAPLPDAGEPVALRIFVDRSSVELFINGGETVMTAQVFPSEPYDAATLSADGKIELRRGTVYELQSIWPVERK